MHSTGLRPLVADLLEAHGYTVHDDESLEGRSGAVYDVPLLAEGDHVLLVEFKDSPDPVEDEDLAYLARLIDDAGADHAVFIHQGPADHGLSVPDGVVLWGPNRLRTLLGDHLVHVQTDATLSPLPLMVTDRDRAPWPERPFQPVPMPDPADAEAHIPDLGDNGLADLLPAAFHDDEEGFTGLDFDALESLDAPVPALTQRATESTTPAGIGPSAIRPKIPVHEARVLVKDRITRIEHETLVLHPVHVIDYECDLMVDGTLRQDTVTGRVQVRGDRQGTTEVEESTMDLASIGTLDWHGATDEHPFRRDAAKALEAAKVLIMESHTKMVDVQAGDDASDFIMTERKKVAPDGDQLRLDHRAATYRPLWRFEGPNGHVTVDGLTGETVEESLRTRSGDTIVID